MNYTEEISFIVSSSAGAGATNVSANGDAFTIQLQQPLKLPSDARSVMLSVPESSIWNVVPNLVASDGSGTQNLRFNCAGFSGGFLLIAIPDGLYTVASLNDTIQRGLRAEPSGDRTNYVQITGDEATGKIVHKFTAGANTVVVKYTLADSSLLTLLGLPATDITGTANQSFTASSIAQFNSLNSLLIHGDIVSQGQSYNGKYSQIIHNHILSASAGSQSVYEPMNPAIIDVSELKSSSGSGRSTFRFWLTDNNNNPITMTEIWTFRLVITYQMPIMIKS